MCLLSQIVESVVSVTGPKALPLELVKVLRQRHLRLLAELLAPGGVGYLVTDFALEPGGRSPDPKGLSDFGKRPSASRRRIPGCAPPGDLQAGDE